MDVLSTFIVYHFESETPSASQLYMYRLATAVMSRLIIS